MKTVFLLFVLLFNQMNAQVFPAADAPEVRDAEFVGGQQRMQAFIAENLEYPGKAFVRHIEGVVTVTLTIDTTGAVKQVKLRSGLGHGCDEEALRIVEAMPNWQPATLNGRPVASGKTLRIEFSMPR